MTSATSTPRRSRSARPKLDAIAAEAVDLARAALEEVTEPGQVGEHLRVEASGDRVVTHVFDCMMPGYRGWSWVAILVRAPRAKSATVAETALLPGEGALLAPDWEPWSERLKPEDVGADDLMPYKEYDERLEHGYENTGDEDADRVANWELGLGRVRVLSPAGRADAAERWAEGEFGPRPTSQRRRRGTVTANCASWRSSRSRCHDDGAARWAGARTPPRPTARLHRPGPRARARAPGPGPAPSSPRGRHPRRRCSRSRARGARRTPCTA